MAVLVFTAVFFVRANGTLQYLELPARDLLIRWQKPDTSMASQVVVIGLSESDIARQEKDAAGKTLRFKQQVNFPISDAQLATLVGKLLEKDPRAVGIDIVRDIQVTTAEDARKELLSRLGATTQPTTQPGTRQETRPSDEEVITEGRQALKSLFEDDRLVGAVLFSDGDLLGKPLDLPGEKFALVNYPNDEDNVVRRGLLAAGGAHFGEYPSFAFRLAEIYLAQETPPVAPQHVPPGDENSRDIQLGGALIRHIEPDEGAYVGADTSGIQFLLDFKTRPDDFKHFTVSDVLDDKVNASDIQGKVVLIGLTSPLVKDYLDTPLGKREQYGVDVHACAVDQILRAALLGKVQERTWPDAVETLWTLAWALLGWWAGWRFRSTEKLALAVGLGVFVLGGTCLLAFRWGWWIPFIPPLFTWVLSAFLVTSYARFLEGAERKVVMQMLSSHVSDNVAKALWDERDQFLEKGRIAAKPVTATVLFTDLKGFSKISENLLPEVLMAWLNELISAMSDVVYRHDGMVNKFIGDAVMAVFGVPVPSVDDAGLRRDACNAVRCAVEMRAVLGELNDAWEARGLPRIGMRIGVYTGPLVAGTLGSAKRLEYTVIGDTVNTASRLESFDKYLAPPDVTANDCRILIGQTTQDLLDCGFLTRHIGKLPLTGMTKELGIYGVIGYDPSASGANGTGPADKRDGDATGDRPVRGDTPAPAGRV